MADVPENPDDSPPRGRPAKLTDEVALGICQAILDGSFRYQAGRLFGVARRTFQTWMSTGRRFPDGLYGTFRRLVLESEAEWERKAVKAINRAGLDDDPRHMEWLLERKYPQRWGRYRGELGELKRRIADLEKLLRETADPAAE